MDNWYYKLFDAEFGPVKFDELVELARTQTLSANDEVRLGDEGHWRRAGSIGQLMTHFPYQSAKKPVSTSASPSGSNDHETNAGVSNAQWSDDDDFETDVDIEPPKVEDRWWCQILGNEVGPMTFEELAELAKNHTMSRDDQVRFGESGHWRRAGSIGPLMAHFPFQAAERVITSGTDQSRPKYQNAAVHVETPIEDETPELPNLYEPVAQQAPVQYAQPAPAQYAQPARAQYSQPAPAQYSQPAPVQYSQPAPAHYAQPAPAQYAQPEPAPFVEPEPAPTPAAAPAPAAARTQKGAKTDERWWCLINDREYGPVDMAKVKEWAASGRLHNYDYLRMGLNEYVLASEVPGLFPKRPEPAGKPSLSTPSSPQRPFESRPTPRPATDSVMSTMSDTAPSITPAVEPRPYTPTPMASAPMAPSPMPSSSMSSPGGFGGGGFGGGSSGYARASVPVRRPTPSKSGSGGGVDLGKLLTGPVGMGVGGVVVVGLLFYFVLPLVMVANSAEIKKLQALQIAFTHVTSAMGEGGKPEEIKTAMDKLVELASQTETEIGPAGNKQPQKSVVDVAKKIKDFAKQDLTKKPNTFEKDVGQKIASARKKLKLQ